MCLGILLTREIQCPRSLAHKLPINGTDLIWNTASQCRKERSANSKCSIGQKQGEIGGAVYWKGENFSGTARFVLWFLFCVLLFFGFRLLCYIPISRRDSILLPTLLWSSFLLYSLSLHSPRLTPPEQTFTCFIYSGFLSFLFIAVWTYPLVLFIPHHPQGRLQNDWRK